MKYARATQNITKDMLYEYGCHRDIKPIKKGEVFECFSYSSAYVGDYPSLRLFIIFGWFDHQWTKEITEVAFCKAIDAKYLDTNA